MALYSVRPSPSPAACEPACGVDVLLGRFLQEHGPHHAVHAVRAGLRLFLGGPDEGLGSSARSCLGLRGGWPVCSIRAGVVLRGRRFV